MFLLPRGCHLGGSKPWYSPEINIAFESNNQEIQVERKIIPFHVDFIMNRENALLLCFANNWAQKNHLKRGKSRSNGSTSSYFNSLGLVGGPGIYLSHLPTGG